MVETWFAFVGELTGSKTCRGPHRIACCNGPTSKQIEKQHFGMSPAAGGWVKSIPQHRSETLEWFDIPLNTNKPWLRPWIRFVVQTDFGDPSTVGPFAQKYFALFPVCFKGKLYWTYFLDFLQGTYEATGGHGPKNQPLSFKGPGKGLGFQPPNGGRSKPWNELLPLQVLTNDGFNHGFFSLARRDFE